MQSNSNAMEKKMQDTVNLTQEDTERGESQ